MSIYEGLNLLCDIVIVAANYYYLGNSSQANPRSSASFTIIVAAWVLIRSYRTRHRLHDLLHHAVNRGISFTYEISLVCYMSS